jgi:hypothetical protein
MTFNDAEAFCMARGAHLATYSNLEEQLDAEGYYIRLGGRQGYWRCYQGRSAVMAGASTLAMQLLQTGHRLVPQAACCPATTPFTGSA